MSLEERICMNSKLDKKLRREKYTYELLARRGVEIRDIAEIVYQLQEKHIPNLTIEYCMECVNAVLKKREVQQTIITGIELDMVAEKNYLSEELTEILMNDEGLYGVDEVLALSIVNVYGSIGLTNFGYVDKLKLGIVKQLDSQKGVYCNTFIDDLVGAVASAAAARAAHANE